MEKFKPNTILSPQQFKAKVGNKIVTENGNCPVRPVIDMLQGKWKLQIIYALCIKTPLRFGELREMLGNVTNTALTNALKELDKDGLVSRKQFNEIPPRVEYSLTDKGRDLWPIFNAIVNWGLRYVP